MAVENPADEKDQGEGVCTPPELQEAFHQRITRSRT